MAFTVSYLRSNFFAAGEFSLAYGITACCASVLLRQQLGVFLAVIMSLSAVALTHSYEATLFLGAFLATLSVVRLWLVPTDTRGTKIMIGIAFIIFLIAVYVGVRSAFFQRSYDGQSVANLGAITEIHLLYLLLMRLYSCLRRSIYCTPFVGITEILAMAITAMLIGCCVAFYC
jgi:hypothetical protein